MSTIKKIAVTLIAVAAALAASACSSVPSAEDWAKEVVKAGFTDPVIVSDDHEATVIMASAGTCRLRFIGDKKPTRLFVTVPDAPMKEEGSYVGDPSLSLIREDKRFAACFPGRQG